MAGSPPIDRRQQILDATVEIIATEGMLKATNRRIAEQAGIPLGHITYYFKSKNELLLSTTERINDVLDRSIVDIDQSAGLGRCLGSMVWATWRWMQRDPDFQIAVIEMSIWYGRHGVAPAPDVYRRTLEYLTELALTCVAEREREGSRPQLMQVVGLFIASLDGLFIQQQTNPDGDYEAAIAQVARTAEAAVG
ncbi:TetR/AcrR family transcriptional regulator [Pseudomonas sp. dw_358]|uniref:TetR/AcrR family transcriptional regulator n=1 Tax=Pseudomonas sp. dw_358 TaxID=2720083 RepID=UPI001BD6C5DE|nr:TetR/AcrR family transcriptional regulator [Pseudomonas sp. dw_358]